MYEIHRTLWELVLADITDMDDANRWLEGVYIPRHNKRFAIKPQEKQTAFIPWIGSNLRDNSVRSGKRT